MESWKNEKMVIAGKKAHITKLKKMGKLEEARKLEETLMAHVEMPKPKLPEIQLKTVKVEYDVPYEPREANVNLPWVEKYRPATLHFLIGPVAPYLRAFVKTKSFPLAMVFYGDYGQGKTAAAKAFIRDYYVNEKVFKPSATFQDILNGVAWTEEYEGCWPPVLYIDATLNSDVETIRDKVLKFMKVRALWNPNAEKLRKFAVFDEADRLGYAAQGALRSLLEKYPNTVTIYTTNRIESIDPAIVSRASGGVFEFRKPDKESLEKHLHWILQREGKTLSGKIIEEIAVACGSVREAVGRLQQEVAVGEC
jgi:DNA polymerase III delta prime subunit